jgi:cell division protein FtsW
MMKDWKFAIRFDPFVTLLTFIILTFGFAIFFSASLGVMARHEVKFYNIVQNQFIFGMLLGSLAFLAGAILPSKLFRNLSPVLFIFGIVLCLLVFVPGLGIEHGGAKRWIEIFGFSFQPSEILKYSSILVLSAFYNYYHQNSSDWRYRILPALVVAAFVGLVLKEPDLGTSTIILSGIFGVFFMLNAKLRDVAVILFLLLTVFFGFYMYYPHAKERVNTFFTPEKNSSAQNYQANQTKISIGSGMLWGDGYGKSTQKFHHLPEPVGDSIFAVVGEEFGFVGTSLVLILILTLAFRLFYLSFQLRDPFPKGVLIGTGVILLAQTFLNAGSSSGAIPFTGVPLPLISHGSTNIIITLGMLGLCAQLGSRKYLN